MRKSITAPIPSAWLEPHPRSTQTPEDVVATARTVADLALREFVRFDAEICHYDWDTRKGIFTGKTREKFMNRQPLASGWLLQHTVEADFRPKPAKLSVNNDRVDALLLAEEGDLLHLRGVLSHGTELVVLGRSSSSITPLDTWHLEGSQRYLAPSVGTNLEIVEQSLIHFVGQRLPAEAVHQVVA